MTTWLAVVGVAVVSYGFRVLPLVVLERVGVSPRLERAVSDAGAAALTALLVGAVRHDGAWASSVPLIVATGAGLLLAARGASMVRVVLAGTAVYAGIAVVGAIVA